MQQFDVTGMSCAACSARVEKAVLHLEGVEACSVNLLMNTCAVEGDVKQEEIIHAITEAGYGAKVKGASTSVSDGAKDELEESLKDKETPLLKRRLVASLGFLIVLMYVSMGYMMWGFPLPAFFERNPLAVGLLQMILAAIVMVINKKFFVNGFISFFHGAPNMDTLVAMGSGAAFVYSTYALFAMTDAYVKQDIALAHSYLHEFYFESAAMILTLITIGKMLEARSKGKTTDALKGLMKLAPKTATLREEVNGAYQERQVLVEEIKIGDYFIVKPGENIPVDGVVIEGQSATNEASLTGESIPVDKEPGDLVMTATVNQSGYLVCQATKVGQDTTLAQIIQMVSDAAATKAPIAKIADRVSGIFVPTVITIAIFTFIIWMFLGKGIGFSIARAISVLVISCPCALGLATPVAIMVGNGVGAKNGILFKTAASLETAGKVGIVALDKTGTITKGMPEVTDVIANQGISGEALLSYAYALEKKSEHPLAKAIVEVVQNNSFAQKNIPVSTEKIQTGLSAEAFEIMPGNGLKGVIAGVTVYGGKREFIETITIIPKEILARANQLAMEGKTPLYFATEKELLGMIAVADVLKEDSIKAIAQLQNMGIHVVMLTGDNQISAEAIGKKAGVNEIIANVLPDGKEQVVAELQKFAMVAMVGDGVNDAPALTRADVGIAIGTGTDIAIDAADLVLLKSSLLDAAAAIRLSRATIKNIKENLFWAFFYNASGIPLAAGAFISLFGWELNPMFGAAAMSLSSFCVVSNALRLNLKNVYNDINDKKKRNFPCEALKNGVLLNNAKAEQRVKVEKETDADKDASERGIVMTRTLEIKGMMCGHCEASVKKALEALPQVTEAVVSYEKGTAIVTFEDGLSDDTLRKTIEDRDYEVVSIQ